MPFKHYAARRYCIPRKTCRVENWSPYEAGLRQRGSITIWLDSSTRENVTIVVDTAYDTLSFWNLCAMQQAALRIVVPPQPISTVPEHDAVFTQRDRTCVLLPIKAA